MCKVFQKAVVCFLACVFVSCSMISQSEQKINGVSFVSSGDRAAQKHISPVVKVHANYAAVMPFAYIEHLSHSNVIYKHPNQWFGESTEGAKQYIAALQKNKIKVMLKPQIWVSGGEFTGGIKMNTEQDWKILEDTYAEFMLSFAKVAQEKNIAIFCIGTELELFVKHRPEYWLRLIQKIKTIYKGKLTYAANWDEYSKTTFWKELDYIGVDGYFPLSKSITPNAKELKLGWQKHKVGMKKHADSLEKKILFTEFGYRSVDYTAHKPWEVDYSKTSVNLEGQVNATQVLFDELWKEDWFAGGFIWKWFMDHEKVGGLKNPRFTPQNKPAEEIIRSFYGANP